MAYHDRELGPETGLDAPMTKLEDLETEGQTPYRPFRRKAALRAETESAVEDVLPPKATEPDAPQNLPQNLPMPLPETWERLRRVQFAVCNPQRARLPLVNFFRDDPAAKAFDVLRTRLLQALKARGWQRVGIAAPTHGCGSTFTAVNLALSLARVPDTRTVLMDFNMRDPGVADALDLHVRGETRGFLRGEIELVDHLVRCSDTLAVGTTDHPVNDAAELLHADSSAERLEDMIDDLNPDVVLYDLPPVLAYDDLTAFLPRLDAVLLVADGTKTVSDHIRRCEQLMGTTTPLLGVVLNRGRGQGLENYAI